MSRLILSLLLLLLIPLNASATPINEDGAQKLKASFQNLLDYQKTINEAFGSVTINYQGELTIKQEADYYSITLPHITVKNPDTEDVSMDLGIITINAMPDDKPEYWKMTLEIPSKITLSDKTEDDDFIINFGKQDIMAIFNDRLGYFTKLDMKLSEISFDAGKEDIGVKLGGIEFYINTEEGEDQKFSGPGHVLINNLLVSPNDVDKSVSIGEVRLDFNMNNIKYPTLTDYKEKLLKHTKTFKSLNNIEEEPNIDLVNGKNVMDMIFDLYDFDMEGFGFQYSLKNLDVTSYNKSGNSDFDNIKVGSAFLGFSVDGLTQEKGSLNIKTGFDSLNFKPNKPEYQETLPQNLNIDISAENIPYKTLTAIAHTSAQSIAENPANAQMVGFGLLMRLPAILSQSGTQLTVENNGIKNDTYNITLDGKVITDLAATMGFSAKFKALFGGLDTLLSISNKYSADPENNDADKFKDMAKTLTKLQSIGQKNGDAYLYEFETTPEGKFLLNGQDASTISFK